MMTPGTTIRRIPWWSFAALVLCGFLLYLPVLDISLLSDDHSAVWWSGVNGTSWRHGFFRPFPDLLLHLTCMLHGPSPGALRAFNILLHGANACLVMLLLHRSYVGQGARYAVWMAAAFFLFYPFHLESTVWVVGRESALGTIFTVSALLVVLSGPPTNRRILGVLLFFFAGILCYESAFLTPLFVIAFALFVRHEWLAIMRKLMAGFLIAMTVYGTMRVLSTPATDGAYFQDLLLEGGRDILLRIPKAYARLIVPPDDDGGLQGIRALIACSLVFVTGFLFMKRTRVDRSSRSLGACLAITLLLAMIPALVGGVSTRTSESGRFLHLPAVFLCSLAAVLLARSLRGVPLLTVVVILLGLEFLALNREQRNWIVASDMTRTILDQLPVPAGNGSVLVVSLPGEHDGAYVFRNGFHDALRSQGIDPDRYVLVNTLLRDQLLIAPDTLVPRPGKDRSTLWPDLALIKSEKGRGSLIAGADTFQLSAHDQVVYWDRHRLRVWP